MNKCRSSFNLPNISNENQSEPDNISTFLQNYIDENISGSENSLNSNKDENYESDSSSEHFYYNRYPSISTLILRSHNRIVPIDIDVYRSIYASLNKHLSSSICEIITNYISKVVYV